MATHETEARKQRKAAKRAAREAVAAEAEEEIDEKNSQRQRKVAKKAESQVAREEEGAEEADEETAKQKRKAAKNAAKVAAAMVEVVEEIDEETAKQKKKAAKKAAKQTVAEADAAEEEVDEEEEEEAKRQRKAARKAAKLAAKVAAAAADREGNEIAPDFDEATNSARKGTKKAAKETIAAEGGLLPKAKKKKHSTEAEEVVDEFPKPKSCKLLEETNQESPPNLRVFIKGLPYSMTEDALRKDFEECGEILNLQFPMDDGKPKGFAFITFATQEGYDASLKYDNTNYNGRFINVSAAKESGKGRSNSKDEKGKGKAKGKDGDWTCPNCGDLVFARNSSCRSCGTANPNGGKGCGETDNENQIFIRGLPFSIDEEQLRKDFAECGAIVSSKMPLNDEGRPRGIAFIKYTSSDCVEAALKFDNTDYGGRVINVCKAGDGKGENGKGKGKDGKSKGKDGKGKSKGKSGKAPSPYFANKTGCIVEGAGKKKTFSDSDDE